MNSNISALAMLCGYGTKETIFHKASKECYMFHKTIGHLMAVEIDPCPVETRFLLCKDK